jgi:OFA family oxalate/formate antiporter-like MFS transporter
MIFAGRVLVIFGPQVTAGIGAILFAAGYLLASFSNGSYGLLLLGLGIITGAGIGFGYVCPLTVGMKWFPNNKGLVTGISVAGFGSGAIILSATADHFLGRGMDVLVFMRWWGIVTGSILLIAAYFLKAPDIRDGSRSSTVGIGKVTSIQFSICAIGIFAGTFTGLLVNGNLIPLVVEFGVEISQSSKAIALFAVGNAVGRIAWGHYFDRLGYKSIPISLIGLSIACTVLLFALPEWMLLLRSELRCVCIYDCTILWANAVFDTVSDLFRRLRNCRLYRSRYRRIFRRPDRFFSDITGWSYRDSGSCGNSGNNEVGGFQQVCF